MKNQLGQFFTPPEFAKLLSEKINNENLRILDLGCGNAQLGLSALETKNSSCESFYVGIEKDNFLATSASKRLNSLGYKNDILNIDALSPELDKVLSVYGGFDYALGNPPYVHYSNKKNLTEIVSKIFPSINWAGNSLRSEIIFLARTISYLKVGAPFSFILPKLLFTSERYKSFREVLLEMVSNVEVIELPDKIFQGADVSTCIFRAVLGGKPSNITLGKSDGLGKLSDSMKVTSAEAIGRMDYSFHSMMKKIGLGYDQSIPTLKSEGVLLKRGSSSRANFLRQSLSHFHTADFPKKSNFISFNYNMKGRFVTASNGDILVPRVGTRILDRQVMVQDGAMAITDCVYRLRAPKKIAEKVLAMLQSDTGQLWRQGHARGSCAKYITNESLLSLPLI